MKRLIPLFLASALLLTGCPGSDKQTDSDIPAETTAAVTEAPEAPADTETEQTDTKKQTTDKAKKASDTKETTAAAATEKAASGTAAAAKPAQEELPVIDGDSTDPAPDPQTPEAPVSENELPFDEDGVIELPIIPIR